MGDPWENLHENLHSSYSLEGANRKNKSEKKSGKKFFDG